MADWQQYLQSVLFGVVFSFLIAKLFSAILAFHDEGVLITRSHQTEDESKPEPDEKSLSSSEMEENESLEGGNVISHHSDGDDDWEGVESTELDEKFSAATAFVAAAAADRAAQKASNEVQLQLYGSYKIATEGPCFDPQPSAFKVTARAKWQAWRKLGPMPPEEAMQKYIDIVTELYPSWAASYAIKKKDEGSSDARIAGSKGPRGPVFSTFVYEDEPGCELKLDAIHAFAREGDEEKLLKCIESGVSLNLKDSEGRTALHWAVDRGHTNTTSLLLQKNADTDAKDNEGQTALHYAAVCGRAFIVKLLVEHGADIRAKDNEGKTPGDFREPSWPWMHNVANAGD